LLRITSFSPSSGRSGTEVTLNVTGIPPGTEMAQVAVRLGAVNATVINLSPALDRVVVRAPQLPHGIFHDYFYLHVATEAATSESQFSVTDAVPPVNPSISSFTPTRPRKGQFVTINGMNLTQVSKVQLTTRTGPGGAGSTVTITGSLLQHPSGVSLRFQVPPSAAVGLYVIVLTMSDGRQVRSSQNLQIT
jgi:hypothetical protein